MPVRSDGGMVTCRRAMGRTTPRPSAVRTTKAAAWGAEPPPARSTSAAATQPSAKGNRKKLTVSTSPTARITAAMAQKTQASMPG